MQFYTCSQLFICLVTSLACTSCVHLYYAPNTNNVPLFTSKGQGRIQAQISAGDNISGGELQSAYAFGEHTAAQLNLYSAGRDDGQYGSGNGTYAEMAAGYFAPSPNKHWVFESYAGIGYGGIVNKYQNANYSSSEMAKTSVTKFFIQPSVGYSSLYFDIAVSSKFSSVFSGVQHSSVSQEHNAYDYEEIGYMQTHKSHLFWEPGFMIRGGFKQIKVVLQYTQSVATHYKLPIDKRNTSIGIMVPISSSKSSASTAQQ